MAQMGSGGAERRWRAGAIALAFVSLIAALVWITTRRATSPPLPDEPAVEIAERAPEAVVVALSVPPDPAPSPARVAIPPKESPPTTTGPARAGTLRGRLVDEAGDPLVGWQVAAESGSLVFRDAIDRLCERSATRTDEEGRFALRRPKGGVAVLVREPAGRAVAVFQALPADDAPATLTVRAGDWRTASLESLVVSPEGEWPQALSAQCRWLDGIGTPPERVPDGRLRLGPLRPGPGVLVLWADGRPQYLRRVDLAADTVLDLGTIDLASVGHVALTALAVEPSAPAELWFEDALEACRVPLALDQEALSPALAPGRYVVRLPGAAERVVEVVPGETVHADLVVGGACAVTFDVHVPRADPSTTVEVEVRDERGARVFQHVLRYRREGRPADQPVDVFATEAPGFGPGVHELLVRSGSGRERREPFLVPRGEVALLVPVDLGTRASR